MLSYSVVIKKVPPPSFDNAPPQVHYEQIQSTVEKKNKNQRTKNSELNYDL